jgi:putative flippase GtrA
MRFLLYCVCGAVGVSSDYLSFYLLVSAGVWYQAANIFSYGAGTLISFALNRVITFKMHDRVLKRLSLFLAVAGCGYLSSAFLLWVLVGHTGVAPGIAKLLTLPVVVAIQYGINSRFAFRPAEKLE